MLTPDTWDVFQVMLSKKTGLEITTAYRGPGWRQVLAKTHRHTVESILNRIKKINITRISI